jgi:hypothetical protein
MRFHCPENGDVRDWHRWFAWYPVNVAPHDIRWLETVERSGKYFVHMYGAGWGWTYRAADTSSALHNDG